MVWAVFRAPYASDPENSRGRLHPEPEHAMRSPFQRDRDRIIHSSAFRRLKHKTQVFVYHEGDHYRTRLTHSLEVAQIARTIARTLGLSEDLAEALALAHDLGHTPFGHAGEEALNAEMAPYGGFSHNDQTLRILTSLERRYAQFDGLNLTWETLEGTAKHNGPLLAGDADHPVNRGTLCPKGAGLLDFVRSPSRLRVPEVREPGSMSWKRIGWDDALDRIAKLMKADRDANFVVKNESGQLVNRWTTTGMLCASASSNETGYITHKTMRSMGMLVFDNQARV